MIALLAISRKFVILDASSTPASTIAALAIVTLVLGIVCWLLREPRAGARSLRTHERSVRADSLRAPH